MKAPLRHGVLAVAIAMAIGLAASARQPAAQAGLPPPVQARIDQAVAEVLAATGAPGTSIAVVQDARLVYARAYGSARLEPALSATAEMRYSIGSISKQFTAAAVLMLVEQGKLSLDDPVARFFPTLTRANEITVRQILTMTSGYQDYWPQDYVMPEMLQPITAQAIIDRWAKKPLDFEPGTKWQYSNTNYVLAGMIVEKLAGRPLVDVLSERLFRPLRMLSVANVDEAPLGSEDPSRYLRYAAGPPRPAPKEGKGWLSAAGELAMTARDLAAWDVSMITQSILQPASYRAMQTDMLLKNGAATGYGLGVNVSMQGGRRLISHGGEVSGFTATNLVYPDDRAAIVVFTNLDATAASSLIANRIAAAIFGTSDTETDQALTQAKQIFDGLQHGRIDRTLFSANANAYFTEQALADFASSLGPLGAPQEFTANPKRLRGGMVGRTFRIRAGGRVLTLTTYTLPDGKLEQFQIAAVESAPQAAPSSGGGAPVASARPFGTVRELAEMQQRWLRTRLDTFLPGLMRTHGIDLWVVPMREYNEDPVFPAIVAPETFAARRRTIYVFFDRCAARGTPPSPTCVERIALGGTSQGGVYEARRSTKPADSNVGRGQQAELWGDDQWAALKQVIEERNPRVIGIDRSTVFAFSDGLSSGELKGMTAALGEKWAARFRDAERLPLDLLAVRLPEEEAFFAKMQELVWSMTQEMFSAKTITPGTTKTSDLVWWWRQRVNDLGLETWFQPSIEVQRMGATDETMGEDPIIQRGDVLHCDVGITVARLNTDTQHLAYVLRSGETDAPEGLRKALANANTLQDITMEEIRPGRTGNQILRSALGRLRMQNIDGSLYTHPIGLNGHAAGPLIGLWDYQEGVPGRGDAPVIPGMWFSIELQATTPVPEWNGQRVRMAQEEDAIVGADGHVRWALRRQDRLFLVR